MPEEIAYWLGHPLIAPIVITATWIPIEALLIAALGTTPGKWLFGVYLQFSISDAYARRDMQAQLRRALESRVPRVVGGHGVRFPAARADPVAVAYEKLAQNQETDWDFAQDVPRDAWTAGRAQCGDRRMRACGDVLALRCRMAPADGGLDRLGADDRSPMRFLRAVALKGGLIADGGLIGGLSLPSMAR